MAMQANLNNGGRWHHIASDREIMRAMRRSKDQVVIEVPMLGRTYLLCRDYLTLVLTGILGGDTFDILGGWVYDSDLKMRADEQEIRILERNPVNKITL